MRVCRPGAARDERRASPLQGAKVDHGDAGRGSRGAAPKSVVMHAADMGDLQVFQLLMDDGAGGRQRTWSGGRGNTPLHQAALYNRLDIVKWCVENGCEVNMPGEHRYTALHFAAKYGYCELVAYLLDAGADAAAISADQKTPAMLSKDEEVKDLFSFFEKMTAGGMPPQARGQPPRAQPSGFGAGGLDGSADVGGAGGSGFAQPNAGMTRGAGGLSARGADAVAGGSAGFFGGGDSESVGGSGDSRASRRAGKGGIGASTAGSENFMSWGDDSAATGGANGAGVGRRTGGSGVVDRPEWLGGGGGGGDGAGETAAATGGASRGRMKNSNA